jgi:predicted transcriptional regulator of viral defense system
MKLKEIQRIVSSEPVFETGLLLAGDLKPASVRSQLSRLSASGTIYQLRRGLYALAPPYQKVKPHPFAVANRIVQASYVSRQSVLSFHGLIPEYVPVVTSVTTLRPQRFDTPLGAYDYRHVKRALLFGYETVELGEGQTALIATPEKALLDLLYLYPGSDNEAYLHELRLQNLDVLDLEQLAQMAVRIGSRKLIRAARVVEEIARAEAEEFKPL